MGCWEVGKQTLETLKVCELQECESHDNKWARNNTLTVKGLHSSPTLGTSLGFSGTPAGVFFS